MHSLLVLVLAVGLAAADVGLGYNYRPPTFATYGVPSYQASASSGQYNVAFNNGNGLNYKGTGQSQGSGYQGSGYHGSGYHGSGYHGSGYQGSGLQQGSGYQEAGHQGSSFQGSGHQGSNFGFQNAASNVNHGTGGYQSYKPASTFQSNYQSIYNGANVHKEKVQYQGQHFGSYAHHNEVNEVQAFQNSYELSSQPAQIFKHFYVHAAPEDDEPPKPRTPIVLPPPQKHYKIIFIKAPTQAASAPQLIPVPQQNEEKTIVYVLLNKPEDAKNIVLPKVEQKPPAKPEVFFIKYNNKEGSQAVIDNIVQDYNQGQSVSFSNVGSGVPPPPSLLFGTYGIPSAQGAGSGNSVSAGSSSSGSQVVANSGFGASNTASQSESTFPSKPLALGVSGVSDGTLTSTLVGSGNTATSNVDNGYSSASSGTGFSGVSSSAGFNGASNGGGYNTATSSTGYNSASSSTGLPGGSSFAFNGVTGGAGFNSGSSGSEYSSGISSTGAVTSLPDSEYNGSTISTSQGVPHETYGVPKFRA